PLAEHLAAHPRPDLPRLENRLAALATGPFGGRSGDLLLLTRFGPEVPVEDRFYFAEPYRSEHGSASSQDDQLALLVAHPSRAGAEVRAVVRGAVGDSPGQLDLVPLLEALLHPR